MTYETSTYFIKGQLKDITGEKLLLLYKDALKAQSVSSFYIQGNAIHFTNSSLSAFLNQRFSKFSDFSDGSISIEENETDFIVFFSGNIKRLYTVPAIIAGIAGLFFLIGSRFDLNALLVAPIVFIFFTAIKFLFVYVFFPVYFTSLRNNIELKYRDRSYGRR
ncbi:hypothetical protein QEG73_10270 [Chitinophagaceae bacterium 26-R-25]|nr:hypothetical protein [Chitinophagaceae bacterium 26-R-25]